MSGSRRAPDARARGRRRLGRARPHRRRGGRARDDAGVAAPEGLPRRPLPRRLLRPVAQPLARVVLDGGVRQPREGPDLPGQAPLVAPAQRSASPRRTARAASASDAELGCARSREADPPSGCMPFASLRPTSRTPRARRSQFHEDQLATWRRSTGISTLGVWRRRRPRHRRACRPCFAATEAGTSPRRARPGQAPGSGALSGGRRRNGERAAALEPDPGLGVRATSVAIAATRHLRAPELAHVSGTPTACRDDASDISSSSYSADAVTVPRDRRAQSCLQRSTATALAGSPSSPLGHPWAYEHRPRDRRRRLARQALTSSRVGARRFESGGDAHGRADGGRRARDRRGLGVGRREHRRPAARAPRRSSSPSRSNLGERLGRLRFRGARSASR